MSIFGPDLIHCLSLLRNGIYNICYVVNYKIKDEGNVDTKQ